MISTLEVLNHHLSSFDAQDVDGLLQDYTPDSVLLLPTGPLKGADAIRPVFESLVAEFAKPGASFTMLQQHIHGDYAYIIWTAETADNRYEFATDTFIVRDGKIAAQSFAARIVPKH